MQSKDSAPGNTAVVSLVCSVLALIICYWPGFDATARYGFVVMFFLVSSALTLAIISYVGKSSVIGLFALLFALGWVIVPLMSLLYLF